MKKISKIQWNNYKNSDAGKKAIADFGKLLDPNATIEEFYELAFKYNPEFFKNRSPKEKKEELDVLNFYDSFVYSIRLSIEKEMNGDEIDYGPLYQMISTILISEDAESKFDDIPQSSFKNYLGANIFFTLILSVYFPEYYIPNFFPMQFVYLKKLAYKYEMKLPSIPARADYKERWMYYDAVCKMLNEFAVENDIQDLSELCAFIFDYEFSLIKEEMEEEHSKPMPAVPEQAWILVGNYGEGEKTMKEGFWQANELTCKGDIMLFYEKSPVKKLNAVWTALDDGVKDPFFHYYSHTYIGHKIEIPEEKAISFAEFKNSEYFQKREKKGNYVSKNFQDVSGWQVTSDDYKEIKRMLEANGFDTSVLPSLYEPKVMAGVEIIHEDDVSWKLLVPRLEEMGWEYKKDFFDEVEFPAGRGTTGHEMDKRPDFCLHLSGGERDKEAQVVIEVKLHMKNNQEIKSNYEQGITYAKWGNARVLVICDKNQIRVYERNKKNQFVPYDTPTARFRWEDLQVLERRNELKRFLGKR